MIELAADLIGRLFEARTFHLISTVCALRSCTIPRCPQLRVTTRASRARYAEAPLEQAANRWLQLVLKPTFTALTPRNVRAGRV
eukprot:4255090-Prymnesium_polylepis.1